MNQKQETKTLLFGTAILTENRRGYMAGTMVGRDARGRVQIGTPTGRIYPVRTGRYITINLDTPQADWAPMYVAAIYKWSRVGDGVQCTHPDDGSRSYHIRQDEAGDWSCSCEAFGFHHTCKHLQAYALINDRPGLRAIGKK